MSRYLPPFAFLILGICVGAASFRDDAHAQEKVAERSQVLKWEYKITDLPFGSSDFEKSNQRSLAKLGDEGWELVLTDGRWNKYIFKRPKNE